MNIDNTIINNSKFVNRFKFIEEKLLSNNAKEIFNKIDREKVFSKRFKANSSIINKNMNSIKNISIDKYKKEWNSSEEKKINICEINQYNMEIKNKIIINEQKIEEYLSSKIASAEKKLNEIYNEILVTRKKNFNTFDNRINFYYKSNKSIRTCKKKLYLLMNFLKLKIIDKRLLNQENNNTDIDMPQKGYLTYFVNIEKNRIKPINISESLDEVVRTIYFWENFSQFFKTD